MYSKIVTKVITVGLQCCTLRKMKYTFKLRTAAKKQSKDHYGYRDVKETPTATTHLSHEPLTDRRES